MAGSSSDIDLSLTNIWHSWVAFRAGKLPSQAIMMFEADLEYNLLQLCADLNNNWYKHGGYTHKIVNEKKRRDIKVANVRDRVVHRLLYDYLVPIVDPKLDYDVWSCRKGKGLHACLNRTQQLLQSQPNADCFEWAAKQSLSQISPKYRQTLTLDNGTEMSNYEAIERATGVKVYFANPYHSWERGTNENTNGLLRFYFPKKTDLRQVTQEQLDAVVRELNTRPRKRLGYRTPEQMLRRCGAFRTRI